MDKMTVKSNELSKSSVSTALELVDKLTQTPKLEKCIYSYLYKSAAFDVPGFG